MKKVGQAPADAGLCKQCFGLQATKNTNKRILKILSGSFSLNEAVINDKVISVNVSAINCKLLVAFKPRNLMISPELTGKV